tara:strand:- start:1198 stop:1344 length:147 start_codon:yes stop_codon:yes gene_type:complete
MLIDMLQQLNPDAVVTAAEDCVVLELPDPDPVAQEPEAKVEARPVDDA